MTAPVVELESGELVIPEWDELAMRTGVSPFRFPHWALHWQAAFGSGSLHVLAAREGGRLVGVLPVAASHGFVRSPTNWHTPEFGVVAESPTARDAVLAAALALAGRQLRLDLLDEETTAALVSLAAGLGRRSDTRVVLSSPYLELEGTFESYIASRSRNTRKQLNRRMRQLSEIGDVEMSVHRTAEGGFLDDFFRLEGSGWKVGAGTALAQRRREEAFYRAVAAWGASRGWLRLSFLRIDGRPVATDLALEADGARYVMKTGYDAELAPYSPGVVLRHHDVADAFAAGLHTYEFLGADDPWKKAWTTTVRPRARAFVFGPGMSGTLSRLVQVQGRAAVRRLRQVPAVIRSRRARRGP